MDDERSIDWSLTTFEGVRRHQHAQFRELSLRDKIRVLEDMQEVAEA